MRKENVNIENDSEIDKINLELRELGEKVKTPSRLSAEFLAQKVNGEQERKVPSRKISVAAAMCGLAIIFAAIAFQPSFEVGSGGDMVYGSSESMNATGGSLPENEPENAPGLDSGAAEESADIVKIKNFEELEGAIDSIKYNFAHVIAQLGWNQGGEEGESSSESAESSSVQESYKLPSSVAETQKKNKVQYGNYTVFSCSLPGREEEVCIQNSKGNLVAGFWVKEGEIKALKTEDNTLLVIYEADKEKKVIKNAFEETGIIFVDISVPKTPKQTGKYIQEGKYIEIYDGGYSSFLVTKRFAVSGLESGDRSYRLRYVNNGTAEFFEPGNIYLHRDMLSLDYVVVSELKAGGKSLALLGGSDVKADADYLAKRMWRN